MSNATKIPCGGFYVDDTLSLINQKLSVVGGGKVLKVVATEDRTLQIAKDSEIKDFNECVAICDQGFPIRLGFALPGKEDLPLQCQSLIFSVWYDSEEKPARCEAYDLRPQIAGGDTFDTLNIERFQIFPDNTVTVKLYTFQPSTT